MKNTIRIGIDARMFSDNFTGIGRYTFEITKHLFEKKTIEISGKKRSLEWVIFLNNPEFSKYNFPNHVQKILVNAPHYSCAEQTKFCRKLLQANCDLVHFSHFNVPLLYRKKSVVTIHDTTLSFFPGKNTNLFKKWLYKIVITNAINVSEKVISVSENTKKDIIQLFKTPSEKIFRVWNGLTNEFHPIKKEEAQTLQKKYNLPNSYLLYSGVWREHKNIKRLLEAFKKCTKNLEKYQEFSDLGLVLTGTPDQKLIDYAQKIGISDRIHSVKKVPLNDLVVLMGSAKAFVFPSLYEGFGLPPLEAMKAKTPVLSSNTSAMPEVCGQGALYFDPYSIDDMADKIQTLLQDKNLQETLIKKGENQIKKFSWENCAEQTFEIYQSTVQ